MKKSEAIEQLLEYKIKEIEELKEEIECYKLESHNQNTNPALLAFDIGDLIVVYGLKYKVTSKNRAERTVTLAEE